MKKHKKKIVQRVSTSCVDEDLNAHLTETRAWQDACYLRIHTEKYFRNLIKSNRNQIVLTIFRLFGTKRMSVWFHINRKMVNTIWFQFDLLRFLCVYHSLAMGNYDTPLALQLLIVCLMLFIVNHIHNL